MRVLITTPTFPPFNSGLGNAAQQQVLALTRAGYSVVVATGGPFRSQRCDAISGAVVEQFDVRGSDSWLHPIRGDIDSYERFLAESDCDVVVMNAWQTWSTDLCLRNLERIRGRKIVYSHCLSANLFFTCQPLRSSIRYLLWRPYWWRLRKVMRQIDRVIFLADEGCDSRFDDLQLARKLAISYRVVPNALSPTAAECFGRPMHTRLDRRPLVSIGAYEWLKGHDFVLRAYARSGAKNVVPLKVFGQCFTAYTNDLRRIAAKLGIMNDFISFHEGVSGTALLDECANAVALVSGSHTECQPLVLLDAMAIGTPFVARSSGCIPALSGGICVSTEMEAANAIDRLNEDESEWQRLSTAGRAAAAERHHPDRVGEQLISALSDWS